MGLLRRARFQLFLFLRLVSQPAYYYYGLGDEVQLSVETIQMEESWFLVGSKAASSQPWNSVRFLIYARD